MITYFEQILKTLTDSINGLDIDGFNRLLDQSEETLRNGGKIIVSGLGKNVPICDKFVGTMVSLGMEAYFLHTNSAVHGDMGIVKKGDLVIILTKSGETAESIYLTRKLEKREITLWLLSFAPQSTLKNEIPNSLILNLDHEGDQWNIVPNNSTTMNLIVLQALAIQLAERLGISLDDFRENHPGGHIGEILKEDAPCQ